MLDEEASRTASWLIMQVSTLGISGVCLRHFAESEEPVIADVATERNHAKEPKEEITWTAVGTT